MIKILYFDTNAIIKYFITEKGSELIRWIVDNRVSESTIIRTSQIALYEFKVVLKKKEKRGEITHGQMKKIISRSKLYFKEVFRLTDDHKIPDFKSNKNTNHLEICDKYKKNTRKDSFDARHLACVINYLRFFKEASRPRIITADNKFIKIIKAEGYDVINPEKITKENFLSIIEK